MENSVASVIAIRGTYRLRVRLAQQLFSKEYKDIRASLLLTCHEAALDS
jgi:hypothetical protein